MVAMSEKQLVEHIDKAIKEFRGDTTELASAIGYLMIGRKFGWRVMFLMHRQGTVRKYEKLLKINSRELMPELGPYHEKSVAYWALQKVTNFWKAVKGEIPGVRSTKVLKG